MTGYASAGAVTTVPESGPAPSRYDEEIDLVPHLPDPGR